MQTPEEVAREYVSARCPARPCACQPCLDDSAGLADLIRARDAEVAEQVRAEVLAGFEVERAKFWEHDEGTGRLRRASTGVVCTRLVGPWEPVGGERS